MQILSILQDYLLWHYSLAYADIVGITRNYLWAANRLFPLSAILKNLFAPFKRLKEEHGNVIRKPGEFFANLVVNIIMRIVGFVVRILFTLIALAIFLLVIGLGVLSALLWTALPVLVGYFFIDGLRYLI